jgi:hypothetical protein
MRTLEFVVAGLFLLLAVIGTLRSVLQAKRPFVRPLEDGTRAGYISLTIAAAVLIAVNVFDFSRVQSFEIGGGKVSLAQVNQKVEGVSKKVEGVNQRVDGVSQQVASLASQLEAFYGSERLEVFDERNLNRLRTYKQVGEKQFILEVTLKETPIPKSVLVMEGPLVVPKQDYEVSGRVLRFPCPVEKPTFAITITYHARDIVVVTPIPTPQDHR